MNKSKNIVIICLLLAVIIFVALSYYLIKGSFEEYNTASLRNNEIQQQLEEAQIEDKRLSAERQKEELELSSIKPVMNAPEGADSRSLSVFGGFFDELVQFAVGEKDLYVRSIEYEMNPKDDPIFTNFSDRYNVCEIKLFLVGTYFSLLRYLEKLNMSPNLLSISKVDISTYSDNTDYVLAHVSINIYSRKTAVQ